MLILSRAAPTARRRDLWDPRPGGAASDTLCRALWRALASHPQGKRPSYPLFLHSSTSLTFPLSFFTARRQTCCHLRIPSPVKPLPAKPSPDVISGSRLQVPSSYSRLPAAVFLQPSSCSHLPAAVFLQVLVLSAWGTSGLRLHGTGGRMHVHTLG